MGTLAAIGIDDDLTSRQTGVPVGAANDELTRGVDIVLDVESEEIEHFLAAYLLLYTGYQDVDDIVLDACQHLLVLVKFVVLGRDDDGVDTLGHTCVTILHGDLALRVGTQVSHHLTLLADVGQRAHDKVGQVERDGHVRLRLISGVAEHHALVAGTLLLLVGTIDATVDVLALLVDGTEDAARVAVELVLRLRITDALDGVTGNGLQVDIHLAADLAHENNLTGRDKRLAGHTGMRVVSQELVENSVRDLVGHLVGMALRHRL